MKPRLTADEQRRVDQIEDELAAHVVEVEKAHAEGKLWDVVKDTPSVEEQLRSLGVFDRLKPLSD